MPGTRDDHLYQELVSVAEAAYRIECRLNPKRIPWDDPQESPPRERCIAGNPGDVARCFGYIRDLLDELYRGFRWHALCDMPKESNSISVVNLGVAAPRKELPEELEQYAWDLGKQAARRDYPTEPPSEYASTPIPSELAAEIGELTLVLAARIRRWATKAGEPDAEHYSERHYSPAELTKIFRVGRTKLKSMLDTQQIRNIKHTTKDYQIHVDDFPTD